MKLEKRSSGADQTPAAAPQETAPKGKKPVVVYIMILFIVAFFADGVVLCHASAQQQ